VNKPAALELCERLEKVAKWHMYKADCINDILGFSTIEAEFHTQAAADIRSIIIPAPVNENETKSKT